MTKTLWREIIRTLNRTVIQHDIKYYRALEQEKLAELKKDQERGMAVPAEKAGHPGRVLQKILDDLLNHPLCKQLTCKPELYVHHDFGSRIATFSNVIFVPFYEWPGEEHPHGLRMLRAALAHELGHMISRDSEPDQQARSPHNYMNQRMERRADLIAAHLCGDGGAALADSLAAKFETEKTFRSGMTGQTSWANRVTSGIVNGLDRRYPSLESRINYLRKWADRFQHGQALPDIIIPGTFDSGRYDR